mgnify:CR=1 FL=1
MTTMAGDDDDDVDEGWQGRYTARQPGPHDLSYELLASPCMSIKWILVAAMSLTGPREASVHRFFRSAPE